jgi:hypothetical protein
VVSDLQLPFSLLISNLVHHRTLPTQKTTFCTAFTRIVSAARASLCLFGFFLAEQNWTSSISSRVAVAADKVRLAEFASRE